MYDSQTRAKIAKAAEEYRLEISKVCARLKKELSQSFTVSTVQSIRGQTGDPEINNICDVITIEINISKLLD